MAQTSQIGRLTTSLAQPSCSRDAQGASRRTATSAVASFSGLKNVKGLPIASSVGESLSQADALRRSVFGSSSATSNGRKAVVCMAAEGNIFPNPKGLWICRNYVVMESVGNLDVEIPGFTPRIMLEHPALNHVASDRIMGKWKLDKV